MHTSKNHHLRQIEIMESEELIAQKKVRSEMIQMEDVLAQIRKEYEMLRIEFEQNMAANEQTAPINREMRHLITSLQNHNGQLKGDVVRYKRKYKDAAAELVKYKKDLDDLSTKVNGTDVKKTEVKQEGCASGLKEETSSDGLASVKEESSSLVKSKFAPMRSPRERINSCIPIMIVAGESDDIDEDLESKDGIKKEGGVVIINDKDAPSTSNSSSDKKDGQCNAVKTERDQKDSHRVKELKVVESEIVRDLKAQLK